MMKWEGLKRSETASTTPLHKITVGLGRATQIVFVLFASLRLALPRKEYPSKIIVMA